MTVLFYILNVIVQPLAPLFAWVPDPATVLPREQLRELLTSFNERGWFSFLYYLNLRPAFDFAFVVVGGLIGMRLALAVLDVALPPIPIVGDIYEHLTRLIRGVS